MLRKDPLIHFLLVGGILFAILSWVGSESPAERIVIPAERVADIARSAELLQGRPPTESELDGLVEQAIREEVYYREALALGLDVDDDEVRRRLIEKMQYLTEDLADPEPPAADLRAFFERDPGRFAIPPLVTFDQVFLSPRLRGDSVLADAGAALAALQAGASPDTLGDSTPLETRFADADPDRVRVLFGDPLTEAVFEAPQDEWIGPFESDFGLHLVRVVERTPARQPDFAEVEATVREAYAAERLAQANAAAFAEMRSHFDIAVQWSAEAEPEAWP
jgi:peptidyl-prolyl cis-trans isomerase C